jgi:hypothetical protein
MIGGKPWDITCLPEDDVRAGDFHGSWVPQFYKEQGLSPEQKEHFSKVILRGVLLSGLCKSWVVSDQWNRLLPDYKFTDAEEFLEKYWTGKD